MLKHITMWNLKPFAAGNDREKNYELIKEKAAATARKCPTVRSLEFGRGLVDGKDFYMVQIVTFDDEKGLKEFLDSPVHQEMHAFAVEVRAERAAYDYIVEDPVTL